MGDIVMERLIEKQNRQLNNIKTRIKRKNLEKNIEELAKKKHKHDPGFNVFICSDSSSSSDSSIFKF